MSLFSNNVPQTRIGIRHSTIYYAWGIVIGLSITGLATSGLSIWIYCLPVVILGTVVLHLIEVLLGNNLHVDEKE